MPKLNEGDVIITLDGEEKTLKPTLRAITMISANFGGLAKAREAIVAQDFHAAVAVIRWGLNLTDKEAKALPDQVFASGVNADLQIPLIRYLGILANGGKPLPDDPVETLADTSTEGNV